MKYKLAECAEIISGGTPKRTKKEYWNGNIPWITVKDFEGKFIEYTYEKISKLGLENSSVNVTEDQDILISARGTVGKIAMVYQGCTFNQSIYGLRVHRDIIMPDYLYYWLICHVSMIRQNTHGSVFNTITKETFSHLVIEVPSLEEQKKIVKKINPFDEKIALNNQINDNLLELAKTIFKNIIRTSSLHALTINDVGTVIGGGTPSKKVSKYWNGNIPWISPKDLSNHPNVFTSRGENSITQNGLDNSSTKLLPQKTVLFSSRAPIGYISIANNEITTNQGFKSVIPDKNYPFWFIYELLKSETPKIINEANGSTFKEISGSKLKQHTISIPTSVEVMKYNSVFLPIFEKIQQSEEEIDKLNQIKNILLNKFF